MQVMSIIFLDFAAIFDVPNIQTSDIVFLSLDMLPGTENMGISVGIVLPYCEQAEIPALTFLRSVILDL